MASLQAVDAWVAKQQQIAVVLVGCGRTWIAVLLDGVITHELRKVLHQAGCQNTQVFGRGDVPWHGQALWVFVARVFHAQCFGLGIHHVYKVFHRAAYAFGQDDGRIVARLNNHAFDQVEHRHLHLGVDKHARALHLPSALTHGHGLLERDFFGLERLEHQISRHQLGQRSRLNRLFRIRLRQHLLRGDVHK